MAPLGVLCRETQVVGSGVNWGVCATTKGGKFFLKSTGAYGNVAQCCQTSHFPKEARNPHRVCVCDLLMLATDLNLNQA